VTNAEKVWLALAVSWSASLMHDAEDSRFWQIFYRIISIGAAVHVAVFVIRGFL
jgi:hypothetical protein